MKHITEADLCCLLSVSLRLQGITLLCDLKTPLKSDREKELGKMWADDERTSPYCGWHHYDWYASPSDRRSTRAGIYVSWNQDSEKGRRDPREILGQSDRGAEAGACEVAIPCTSLRISNKFSHNYEQNALEIMSWVSFEMQWGERNDWMRYQVFQLLL